MENTSVIETEAVSIADIAPKKAMSVKEALLLIGGLSSPSKMPCHGWSTPAEDCITGSKLAKVEGTVCHDCYALKGMYRFPNVKQALKRRKSTVSDPRWVEAFVIVLKTKEHSGYFRWFDSGDLQSAAHLDKIAQVCRNTPEIQHWLPTKEYGFTAEWLNEGNMIPDNLTIRLSAYKTGHGQAPAQFASGLGVQTSEVVEEGFDCPASHQDNECRNCRNCWDKEQMNVIYHAH